ncbi:hypothetical protein [Actinospongicola halichondriae]|uniref:hypothetical protein n=1 Tax=Actinospongicola halichondriae TaxID=3236844 RepID=UPI003D4BC39C
MQADSGIHCHDVAAELSDAAEGHAPLSNATRAHVEACLRCQADLVQYRKLLRSLRSLRTEVLQPAPGLLPEILAGLEHAGERHAIRAALHGRRAAYIGGIAAATAAGAAGAIVLASRSKRLKLVG